MIMTRLAICSFIKWYWYSCCDIIYSLSKLSGQERYGKWTLILFSPFYLCFSSFLGKLDDHLQSMQLLFLWCQLKAGHNPLRHKHNHGITWVFQTFQQQPYCCYSTLIIVSTRERDSFDAKAKELRKKVSPRKELLTHLFFKSKFKHV